MADKREFETPKVFHDAPLRDEDLAHFHFDDFAVTLARLIASPDTRTPLTIGVSGPWGSGKTTLLRRVKKMLDDAGDTRDASKTAFRNDRAEAFRRCRTVWFDAWKYHDENALLVALIRVILNAMAGEDLSGKFWSKVLDPQKPRYDVLATFLNMFKLQFGGVEIGVDLAKHKTETPFASHTAFFDFFDDAFETLLARWVGGKLFKHREIVDEQEGALVVFVDDLDRCLPAKTVQVLEAVKLFLDKTGCVFMLGADTNVVRDAVASHYKDVGVTGVLAGDYLEKIVQLRFELPPIVPDTMGEYLSDEDMLDAEVQANWQILVAGADINPRKVKTVINDLNLRWAMLRNSDQAAGVDRDDFTHWNVLMRVAPDGFKRQVNDLPKELRHKFIDDALKWVRGDESVVGSFKAYEDARLLRRVLAQITFSDQFTADVLDAFVHLTAPPAVVRLKALEATAQVEPITAEAHIYFADMSLEARGTVTRGARLREGVDLKIFGGIEFVRVPRGKFVMGSKDDNKLAWDDERPQHTVEIPYDYWMARYPVTNEQFAAFVGTTHHVTTAEKEGERSPEKRGFVKGFDWRNPLGPKSDMKDKGDHPVVQVSWHDAVAYCQWLSEALRGEIGDLEIRLPTEAEWEKAARGEFGNEWPWGNEFDPAKCNSSEGGNPAGFDKDLDEAWRGKGGTTPVGAYSPAGDSPYGASDMVGNVWEWCHSLFKAYPYDVKDGREATTDSGLRVLRGGSFNDGRDGARAAARLRDLPGARDRRGGLRVVVAPRLSELIKHD